MKVHKLPKGKLFWPEGTKVIITSQVHFRKGVPLTPEHIATIMHETEQRIVEATAHARLLVDVCLKEGT